MPGDVGAGSPCLRLDTAVRADLVNRIVRCLVESVPGSEALLKGSLARHRADPYSDMDVLWDVPDEQFRACVDNIAEILSRVQTIESVRLDPAFQNSEKRRLIFVRFRDIPLFWRLDLEVFARSVQRDRNYDVHNPHARGSAWSPEESALANVVAAVKAHLRHRDKECGELLARAYQRVGLPVPQLGVKELMLHLLHQVPIADPKTEAFAKNVQQLVAEAL